MVDMAEMESIRLLGVEFSRKGIASVYGARTDLFIAHDDIREIKLRYGQAGERRWLQIPLAVVILGAAVLQIVDLLRWLFFGGTRYDFQILVLVVLIGVGGWLLWDAVRKQWYMEVQTLHKTRKLAFHEKVSEPMLQLFVQYAQQFGYSIDASELARLAVPAV